MTGETASAPGFNDPFAAVEWNGYIENLKPGILAPGEILVRQGDKGDAAYFVTEGSVRIFLETHYGPVTLAQRHAPCLIGEIAVFAELPRTASAEALTPVTYYEMDRRLLLEIGAASPELLVSVIRRMGQQIDGINQVISTYTGALAALESSDLDPAFLETLANPSPQVAEFAAAFKRFATQIVERRRQQDELSAAASLQRSFLPPKSKLANLSGRLELDARMRPAREVGGDFYDYFMIDDGRLAVVIGDICGKGMPACIFMAVVITVLRAEARRCRDVQETVARANELLCQDNATSMFATVFFCVLDLATGELEYCNCGHNAPVIRHGDGSTITLPATGLPLGLFASRQAARARASLPPDALLFLYTDGVTEAANAAMEEYGEERLGSILASFQGAAATELIEQAFSDVDRFAAGTEQADDITCIAIRRKA